MDFNKMLGATLREVENAERDGKATHIVRVARTYATTPGDLWTALTNKERIRRWFAEVSGDFECGGRFSIKGNANGKIIACAAPKLFALTWEFGGNVSWVTIKIKNADEGVHLTLEHELASDEQSEAHWQTYGPGATGVGWELALLGLEAHQINPKQSLLEAAANWMEGAQGKATVRNWAQAWGAAHIQAGGSVQSAKDAAERTAKFYTGEE